MRKNRLIREITGWKQHSHNMFLSSTALVNEDWSVNGDWAFAGNVSSANPISAADPVDLQDLVTLSYFNTNAGLYQGVLDASAGIAYPTATEGMFWRISVAGVIGTVQVEVGDQVIAIADYAGGMDDTKFMIVQTTTQITPVTYAQLSTLITNSKLEAGRHYLITDYATAYNIFDGGTNAVIEAQVGTVEPLIVVATGESTLAKEAYSELYPQDIIYYNPLVNAVDLAAFIAAGDIGYVTAGSLVANFKGVIEFRHDTKQNVSTWYDFRNIKFRRWAVDAVAYDGGTAYVAKDVCKSGVDGKIYKCITATTGEGDPTVNTADWILWWDIVADAYISWTSDKTKFEIGRITTTYLVFVPATFQDVYTFGSWYQHVNNVTIGKNDLALVMHYGCNSTLNNIVFKTADNLFTCCSNEIGVISYNNTIGNGFCYNTIGNYFSSNTIGNYFNTNTIGNNFGTNTIGYDFDSNTIGNDFTYNTIGYDFKYNNIGNRSHVSAGISCQGNSIGDRNTKVTFGDDCTGISIGEKNGTITLGANCSNLTFKNGCTFTNTNATALINTTFENGSVVNGLDFAAATHIKAAYSKTVFTNATPAVKLSYFDARELIVVNVNA